MIRSSRSARVGDEFPFLVLQSDASIRVPALLAPVRVQIFDRPVRIDPAFVCLRVDFHLPVREVDHLVVVLLDDHRRSVRVLPLLGNVRAVWVGGADRPVREVDLRRAVLEAVLRLATVTGKDLLAEVKKKGIDK